MSAHPHVVIVGGGIAGLATAYRLLELSRGTMRVTVLEASDRFGGKIRTEAFAGRSVDVGAEALLTRIPEALALCRELGLGEELVSPATDQAFVWTRHALRPLPPRLLAGAPGGAGAVRSSGIVSLPGLGRAAADFVLPARPLTQDVSIGELVRRRLGGEMLERLIDPLLGGIHAGSCDHLSVSANAPQLELALRSGHGLVRGLRSIAAGAPGGPMFMTLRGGLERLVDALVARLSGAELANRTSVQSVTALPDGRYRLVTETDDELIADRVVLAVPAFAAAKLLGTLSSDAAVELSLVSYASVASVLLAYAPQALPSTLATGSGFLVPQVDGRTITASTWASRKWAHLAGDPVIVKAAVGRANDPRALELPDEQLTVTAHRELAEAMSLRAEPLFATVVRFDRALPQYSVGHLERVARIESSLADFPGIELAGAAYHGVGVGACIRDGERVANRIAVAYDHPVPATPAAPTQTGARK